MAQDRQQMDEEVASLRRARNDLENKLDAAMENRSARIQEDELKAKQSREKHNAGSPRGGRKFGRHKITLDYITLNIPKRASTAPTGPQGSALEWHQGER